MKAYQCKVSIKNSKPPVWWRCWIPAGISFSALSLVLDELTGERLDNGFRFEIYQSARIWEPSEDTPLKSTYDYCAFSAAHTRIDPAFELGHMIYYYGSERTVKIEIEKQTDDYCHDHPLPVKSVGDETASARMGKLTTRFQFQDNECPPLTRREILESEKDGKLSIGPVREEEETEQGKTCLPSTAVLLYALSEKLREIRRPRFSMRKLVESYSERDIRELAEYYLPITKGRRLLELLPELVGTLLEPANVRQAFVLLSDSEIAAFEAALEANGPYRIPNNYEDDYDKLRDLGYVFIEKDGVFVNIPVELDELYPSIDTPEFREERQKLNWVMRCLNKIVPPYYGIIPVKKFCRLCRRTKAPLISAEEVPTLLERIPVDYSECVLRGYEICTKELANKPEYYDYIVFVQRDKPYYIMHEKEIAELLEYGYPLHVISYRWFKDYLTGELGFKKWDAEDIMALCCQFFAFGHKPMKCLEVLDEYGARLTQKQLKAVLELLQDAYDNTPTCFNRGYTPMKMRGVI